MLAARLHSHPGAEENMLQIRRILVPVDFSEASQAALGYACQLADAMGAEVEVLHVWEAPADALAPGLSEMTVLAPEGRTTVAELMRVRATQRLAALVSDASRAGRAKLRARTEFGDAGDMILKIASSGMHDLVVMGTHGRRGLSRVLMGSVAEKVLRRAPCPVVTVRNDIRTGVRLQEVAS
jgi:nucleotide-binding universal stress UspA family protein